MAVTDDSCQIWLEVADILAFSSSRQTVLVQWNCADSNSSNYVSRTCLWTETLTP